MFWEIQEIRSIPWRVIFFYFLGIFFFFLSLNYPSELFINMNSSFLSKPISSLVKRDNNSHLTFQRGCG